MWAAKNNGSDINWQGAKSYCENYRGGGYTDWRMPTADELEGLHGSGNYKNVINISELWVWASEVRSSEAATIYFFYSVGFGRAAGGGRKWVPQSYSFGRALPVRSTEKEKEAKRRAEEARERSKTTTTLAVGTRPATSSVTEIARDGRFIAYNNGTVLDTSTNLMWAAKNNGSDINWQGAKSYCENYRGGGYTDWRMPTADELAGLYGSGNYKNVIMISDLRVWASETRGSEAATFCFFYSNTGFLILRFGGDGRQWVPQSYGSGRALPVRSGK
jgi:hypothetical protein